MRDIGPRSTFPVATVTPCRENKYARAYWVNEDRYIEMKGVKGSWPTTEQMEGAMGLARRVWGRHSLVPTSFSRGLNGKIKFHIFPPEE